MFSSRINFLDPPGCFRRALTAGRPVAMMLGVVLFASASLFVMSSTWGAEQATIAVLSPDIGEPYRGIFTKIVEGIEDKLDTRVVNYPVKNETDISALKAKLHRQNAKVVIALGRQGMKAAVALNNDIKVVVGGVLTVHEEEARNQPVVSLSPDPALLFARMKSLMPSLRRVFVVYNPKFNDWLVSLANEAALAQGLELVTYEARDMRNAVHFYQEFLSAADSRKDALWLPQDPTTVEESTILPLVLQESWDKNIAVFSSNFGHVRRGVLFSLYPDNEALGASLGGLAQDILKSGEYGKRGMLPLRDVLVAVNLRTAQHLGLNLRNQQQSFDSVFPEP